MKSSTMRRWFASCTDQTTNQSGDLTDDDVSFDDGNKRFWLIRLSIGVMPTPPAIRITTSYRSTSIAILPSGILRFTDTACFFCASSRSVRVYDFSPIALMQKPTELPS